MCRPAACQPVPAQQQRLRLLLKAPGEGGVGALLPLQQRWVCDHCSGLLRTRRNHSCLCAVDAPAECKREGDSLGVRAALIARTWRQAKNLRTHTLKTLLPAPNRPTRPPRYCCSHAAGSLQAARLPGVLGKRAVHFRLSRLEHGVGHLQGVDRAAAE